MSILFGIIGFIAGFGLGQFLLFRILHDLSRAEVVELMQNDWSAKLRFGLLNWGLALAGAVLTIKAWHILQARMS